MKVPQDGGKKIYSCNEGNLHSWDEPIKDFVKDCKNSGYAARCSLPSIVRQEVGRAAPQPLLLMQLGSEPPIPHR